MKKWLLICGLVVAGGFALILTLAAFAPDDSPKARAARIKDECNRTYGPVGADDCFVKLGMRMLLEKQRDDLDRTYQRAR